MSAKLADIIKIETILLKRNFKDSKKVKRELETMY